MTIETVGELLQPRFSDNLEDQIHAVHIAVSARYPVVDRIAIARYESETDLLRTFVSSNVDNVRLAHYSAKLSDVPSLQEIVLSRQPRIIDDIESVFRTATTHTNWLKQRDYRSSFTVPIFDSHDLVGFLFFDSKTPAAFDKDVCAFLETIANLIAKLHLLQVQVVNSIAGMVSIITNLAKIRDHETGEHLQRIAAYASLIASELVKQGYPISDEYIGYIHLFAPLHDIGKVGIPDSVLLKPGKLDADEWAIMQTHVAIGESIANQMGKDLEIGNKFAFDVMHNIIAYHHERGDGSGYPRGLFMEEIPIEARIVAVADVYDALSTPRPYKTEWTEERIRTELETQAACNRLDPSCVRALINATEKRREISQKFHS